MSRRTLPLLTAVLVSCLCATAWSQEPFKQLVGDVKVGPVKSGGPLEVPYITWGGDVATFYANGGLTTAPGTIFQKQGLNLKLVAGDDFVEQVRRYQRGDSPFLRGTFSMIGLASEVLGDDPRTKAVVFLQLTWSAGDHMVSREALKKTNDLKGKKIALQKGGPHVGMLDDILRLAGLKWSDVNVVWADELTGPKSPAAMFRKDASIDACMVISPDMISLTGGLDVVGTGAEGTVKGAKVLDSTAYLSRSIADVYAVRKDYYDANKEVVEKFTAGYLKACEEIVPLKKVFDSTGNSPKYMDVLKLTQTIYGKEVSPTLDVDAHGLISDCTFVGLPGNISFFTDTSNLAGFEKKQQLALDLAVNQGYAKVRTGFFPSGLDYDKLRKLGSLTAEGGPKGPRITNAEVVNPSDFDPGKLDERTILTFTINFEPNQDSFPLDVYGADFQKALEVATTYGNTVLSIRGHSDPTKTLADMIRAGMTKGTIQRSGAAGNYKYFLDKKPLDLADTSTVVKAIEAGGFDGTNPNPRETMQAALNLSFSRARAVREAIMEYAKTRNVRMDESQLQPTGVGVREPLIARPTNLDEAKQNMRVEFRILKIPAEAIAPSDFDF